MAEPTAPKPNEGSDFGLHTDFGDAASKAAEEQAPDEGANYGLNTDKGK